MNLTVFTPGPDYIEVPATFEDVGYTVSDGGVLTIQHEDGLLAYSPTGWLRLAVLYEEVEIDATIL